MVVKISKAKILKSSVFRANSWKGFLNEVKQGIDYYISRETLTLAVLKLLCNSLIVKLMRKGKINFFYFLILACWMLGCSADQGKEGQNIESNKQGNAEDFEVKVDQFADVQILRYEIPGFEDLSAKEKELVYYLYQAGLSGRDIIYDQNYKHNLVIRRTIEAIIENYAGDKNSEDYNQFLIYAKRVWVSNGIHHHYSTQKMVPGFSSAYFAELLKDIPQEALPLSEGEDKKALLNKLTPIIFDATIDAKRVNQDASVDMVATSANNFYEGVTEQEVERFYAQKLKGGDDTPLMYGLNSKLVKENGRLVEKVYKVGGMYGEAIEKIVYWLGKASQVAENEKQKAALDKLIQYYKSGDLRDFDAYNIAWVADTSSVVDVISGFIEVYGDAMGYKGAYESVVSIKDQEASERMAAIAHNAQWFEDNSPIMDEYKKKDVTGISYKVVTVAAEAGDAAPSTPIGINLPNSAWIRKAHGSKSVSLGNITDAYSKASGEGSAGEFAYSDEEKARAKEYGVLAGKLHTALHEVIGHASGQLHEGVRNPAETLKNYASPLEEARADLVALYYIMDPKMVEIGIMPSLEVGKAEYEGYIRNGMMLQLRRLNEGDNIEQAHMRNRQMIAAWVYEKGKAENVIEKKVENEKTYFVINDYEKLRNLFGQLLREIQRIKSEGDYDAGRAIIEDYGVKVDQDILKEVKKRYEKMASAPYAGFIQPKLIPVMTDGRITDVKVEYPRDFVEQMMFYGKEYSFLPNYN